MQTLQSAPPIDNRRHSQTCRDRTRGARLPDWGIASLSQFAQAGFTRAQIDVLVGRGAIVPVHDGVYRTASTRLSPRRQLLAGCLAIGGVVGASHRAALWLWDLTDTAPPVELTASTTRRPIPSGSVVHVRDDLCCEYLTVHRGVPVTTPARTLVDVGSVVDHQVLATAVDKALYLRMVTLADLAHQCAGSNRANRPGVGALRSVLKHRLPRV